MCVCVEDMGVELNGAHTSSFPISIWVYVTIGDVLDLVVESEFSSWVIFLFFPFCFLSLSPFFLFPPKK